MLIVALGVAVVVVEQLVLTSIMPAPIVVGMTGHECAFILRRSSKYF